MWPGVDVAAVIAGLPAARGGSTSVSHHVPAARAEFDRIRSVEYSIVSVTGADLEISKENEKVRISFAYNREIDLFGPAFLLIKYEGRSR